MPASAFRPAPSISIVVVETDTKAGGHAHDGEPSLKALEAKRGTLPETLQAISPSGSVHRYFRHPGRDIKIKTAVRRRSARGVDVRGDGGMVLAPPTINPAGRRRLSLDQQNPIAPMPAWLIELTREKPRVTISQRAVAAITINGSNGYGTAAMQYEIANIHRAEPGHRNAALNKAGFSLGQLVAIGLLSEAEVARLL